MCGGKTAETQFLEGIDSSPSKNGKFAVYPAPFSSFLQLEYQDLGFENSGKVEIALSNSLGMRVYSHSYQEVFEQGTLSITNLSHLPSGIYCLEVAIEGQPPQLFKCIKQ
ncbi:T9SS type A sorting domain-containing protein [Phaeodactylibacter sp.]|uniref:T9SS type A sorting domain-containing protein n=1 Tax=Phaeodactylibacter sp. TaxID=1940289 RepID=UPI0025FF6D40|nr:T9SS type A sorting domain-containing protein [Phaeodactylibacter sp.]MCI4650051.1 T9SS type A sorting domain-containing protein [Phaeodactylibacter sp.]MCI5091436.1 T9SS type A sorting domain-containing protein [Phaeodactylibacter sp.]